MDSPDRDVLRRMGYGGPKALTCHSTESRENIRVASLQLFADAAARLQQTFNSPEKATLDRPGPTDPCNTTLEPCRDSLEIKHRDPAPASQFENNQSFTDPATSGHPQDLSSFQTYHSNESRSTLASSTEIDPGFNSLQQSFNSSEPAGQRSKCYGSFRFPIPPSGPNRVDKDYPSSYGHREKQFDTPATQDYSEFQFRPHPFRRAVTEGPPGSPSRPRRDYSYRRPAFQTQPNYQGTIFVQKTRKDFSRPRQQRLEGQFSEPLPHGTPPNSPAADHSTDPQPQGVIGRASASSPNPSCAPIPKLRHRAATTAAHKPYAPCAASDNRVPSLDLFPRPHQFSTLKPGSQFDPLNFVPGGSNPLGTLYLPEPPASKTACPTLSPGSPTTQRLSTALQGYKAVPDVKKRVETTNSDPFPVTQASLPYIEFPLIEDSAADSKTQKAKKTGVRKFTLSLKKLFSRRSKSEPENTTSYFPFDERNATLAELRFIEHLKKPLVPINLDSPDEAPELRSVQFIAPTMNSSGHLDPTSAMVAITKQKSEAMRLAREQQYAVTEMCRRAKSDVPPYTFEELIGKGSYGRVYKGRHLPSHSLVAIKVMDIDKLDYESSRDLRDESIKDFIHETKVMKQVKDAGAKNINMLIEAVSIHSQLWLVCEYCPGGSVKTLMRATGDKLDERFIIPIARELAIGLKAIHDAGIIHRDIKSGNVLIHEEGRLEICDFGVAGVLQSQLDKRSTWIGTPHWMAPEMFPSGMGEAHQYGSEIDVWAYGCTLYECATGNPPNAGLRARMQIGRQLNRVTPRLEGDAYSDGLKSLISYALDSQPMARPTMTEILQHDYIAGSEDTHPTSSLRELVKIYYQWSQRGGQRISLFNPGGAVAAEIPGNRDSIDEGWSFSTTAGFEKRFSLIDMDQISASLAALENERPQLPQFPSFEQFDEPGGRELSADDEANFNERVKRGAAAMAGLFDEAKPNYTYETKNDFVPVQKLRNSSDLPLRTETDRSSVASTFIDINLGVYDSSHYASASATGNPPFQLADADTIRAIRNSTRLHRNSSSASSEQEEFPQLRGPRPPTMDWKFPSAAANADESSHDTGIASDEFEYRGDKRDTRTWTFPVMNAEEDGPVDEPVNEAFESFVPEPSASTWRYGPSDEPVDEAVEFDLSSASTWRMGPSDEPSTVVPRTFPLQRPSESRNMRSIDHTQSGPTTESRPSTSASEADYNPFRLDPDAATHVPEPPRRARQQLERAPSMRESVPLPLYHRSQDYDHRGQKAASNGASQDFDSNSHDGSLPKSVILRNNSVSMQSGSSSIYSAEGNDHIQYTTDTAQRKIPPFPEPRPPNMESLMEGASDEDVTAELDRLFGDLMQGLGATREAIANTDTNRAAESDRYWEE
ncbi:hypothetical protein FQN57_006844 [Myotisia sp. PD_48]|nr:hypothetical protein FQN57_006844 [Myotisia sp. PD_48]